MAVGSPLGWIAVVAAGIVFGGAAYRVGWLDAGGAVAGAVLAVAVLGLGGMAWAVPSFAFFASSSLLSRVGRRRKREAEALAEKGARRDAGQVLANGGVGLGLLLVHAVHPAEPLYFGFLGAFAAAAADTWATEVGTLAGGRPRLLTTGRPVAPGTSGAVSLAGTVSSVLGAAVVALAALPFVPGSRAAAVGAVVVGGVLGACADSLAGATVQARFRDPATGALTERRGPAEAPYERVSGWPWLRNDAVNGLCTAVGAAAAAACATALNFGS